MTEPVRVLVLYSHALMGEGLERMLADEPGIVVRAVDVAQNDAVDDALAGEPCVIVVEEGGGIDAVDIARRCACNLVLGVDINTTQAWTLRRECLASHPDDFLAIIRDTVTRRVGDERPGGQGRADGGPRLQPAAITG